MKFAGLFLLVMLFSFGCSNLQFSDFSRSMDVADQLQIDRYPGS